MYRMGLHWEGDVLALANDTHDGVMVALKVPSDAAKLLALPGGEPADSLHITLVYMDGSMADALSTVRDIAATLRPYRVAVIGRGSFPPSPQSDGKVPIWADPSAPGLQSLHQTVRDALSAAGLRTRTPRAYKPHITLVYADPESVPDVQVPFVEFVASTLVVAQGDTWEEVHVGARSFRQKLELER